MKKEENLEVYNNLKSLNRDELVELIYEFWVSMNDNGEKRMKDTLTYRGEEYGRVILTQANRFKINLNLIIKNKMDEFIKNYKKEFNDDKDSLKNIIIKNKKNDNYKRDNMDSDSERGINELKEPPIGLIPKYIHDTKRFRDVCEAIVRYYENNMKIPIEWVEEYNEMIERIHK